MKILSLLVLLSAFSSNVFSCENPRPLTVVFTTDETDPQVELDYVNYTVQNEGIAYMSSLIEFASLVNVLGEENALRKINRGRYVPSVYIRTHSIMACGDEDMMDAFMRVFPRLERR